MSAAYDLVLVKIRAVYDGRNADATKALYDALKAVGPQGELLVDLFRASRNSTMAKGYRRGSSTRAAYDTKQWALGNICRSLSERGAAFDIRWGWKIDPAQVAQGSPHCHVLYVDTPHGQVSFHTDIRGNGPDYRGEWDGVRMAAPERLCRWAAELLAPAQAEQVPA